jgi:hypothetical protein
MQPIARHRPFPRYQPTAAVARCACTYCLSSFFSQENVNPRTSLTAMQRNVNSPPAMQAYFPLTSLTTQPPEPMLFHHQPPHGGSARWGLRAAEPPPNLTGSKHYRCTFGPPGPARPKPEKARIVWISGRPGPFEFRAVPGRPMGPALGPRPGP